MVAISLGKGLGPDAEMGVDDELGSASGKHSACTLPPRATRWSRWGPPVCQLSLPRCGCPSTWATPAVCRTNLAAENPGHRHWGRCHFGPRTWIFCLGSSDLCMWDHRHTLSLPSLLTKIASPELFLWAGLPLLGWQACPTALSVLWFFNYTSFFPFFFFFFFAGTEVWT
jgi:hypothetical protein